MGQQEISFIAGGITNGIATLEDILAVSYKSKYALTLWCSNYTPWYLSKGVENLGVYKDHADIYGSFTHNCQNLEATKMFFSRWMDK